MFIINLNKFCNYRKKTFCYKKNNNLNIFNVNNNNNFNNKEIFSFNENVNKKKLKLNNLPYLNNQKNVFKSSKFNYKNKFFDLLNTTNNFNKLKDKKKIGEILFKNSFSTKNLISNKLKIDNLENEQKNLIFNKRKFEKFYTTKTLNKKIIKFNNSENNILNQTEKKNLFKLLLNKKIINVNNLIKKSINDLKISKIKIINEYLSNNQIQNEKQF